MASPPPNPTNVDPSPPPPAMINEDIPVVARQVLNPTAPMFFPNRYRHFSPPSPVHFVHFPPPPVVYYYYPSWLNNPNRFLSRQEMSPSHSNPRQQLALPPPPPPPPRTNRRCQVSVRGQRFFGRRRNKTAWRRRIRDEVESDGDDHVHHFTTAMLRNIPNKYSREMMIEFLDKHCEEANKDEDEQFSAYDFFYLPMDFKSGMNKGYAFVNFTNTEAVRKFKVACNNKSWAHCSSRKVLKIASARIQGKEELVHHFELMIYPVEAYSAVWFNPARSGSSNEVETIMVGMVGKCIEPITSL